MKTPETIRDSETSKMVEDYIVQADEILRDVRIVSDNIPSIAEAAEKIRRSYVEDLETIATNTAVRVPVIAFVGEKGIGKSSLIQLLLRTGSSQSETDPQPDKKLRWIGPAGPPSPNSALEEIQIVTTDKLADLGRPYAIIDTPGFGTASKISAECLSRAFKLTKIKILVLNQNKLGIESDANLIETIDGSIVLPVIRLNSGISKAYRTDKGSVEKELLPKIEEMKLRMRGAKFMKPIFLGDFDTMGDSAKAKAEASVLLVDALRNLLATHHGNLTNRKGELEVQKDQFETEIREVVAPLLSKSIEEDFQELEEAIGSLPADVVHAMLEDKRQLHYLFRLDLRGDVMDRISMLAFPFRTLAGLLCLTAGAWDRLILGIAGSVPSAVITMVSAIKGRKQERDADQSNHEKLNPRVSGIVTRKINEPLEQFRSALAKHGNHDGQMVNGKCEFEIRGVAQFASFWQFALREAPSDVRNEGKWIIGGLAFAGTLVFWLLFGAPLIHTYGQYVPAAFRSLSGKWSPENLADYPSMSGAFWLTALVLSTIPVFICALLLIANRLSKKKINQCISNLERIVESDLKKGNISISIEPLEPKIKAYGNLLKNLPKNTNGSE